VAGANTFVRILSALVLAPLALAAAWYGDWPFTLFWLIAALAVLWEWTTIVVGKENRLIFAVGAAALLVAALIVSLSRPITALFLIALGALSATIFSPAERRGLSALGVGYAGLILLSPVVLRMDAKLGMVAILFLFAVVWTTDILGYFGGRAIGGPKLAPAVSPSKTWSGAIAGLIGTAIASLVAARYLGATHSAALVGLGLLLSVAAQLGDLAESAFKRKFHVKDASGLIPGHGGVMDRLDGFWAAALVAAAIGLARGGFEGPATGLLIW
jgi:phosphatidate cytidylyltransferase